MISNNKAISPIIATVVLLTLVVVIAGIIYKSGTEFIGGLSPPAQCDEVSFDAGFFKEPDGSISVELTNQGIRIESLSLEIISESNGQSDNQIVFLSANPGESVKQQVNFEIPDGSKIKIIPQIYNAKGEVTSCPSESGKITTLKSVNK